MKVLLLADDFGGDTLDPAGLWSTELVRACRRRGHGLEIVCNAIGASPGRSETSQGLVVQRADPTRVDLALGDALGSHPDIVHVMAPGPFNARVIEALAEFPVLLELHDHWPICPQFDLLRRPMGRACEAHHPFEGCLTCTDRARLASMEVRAALVASARAIAAHGETTRSRIARALGRPVERLDYGVDTARFCPEPAPAHAPAIARLAATKHGARVLLLGPPTAARGAEHVVDLLVALAARVSGIELVVAGVDPDDPGRGTLLRDETRALGLEDRLVLLPVVEPDDLPALMTSCDLAIAPGLAPDPGGLFVVMAFACGLPVVAHPSGDLPALFDAHDGAVAVPATDIGGFAHEVARLLSDPTERTWRADAARLAAIERHDLDRTVVAIEAMWERLRRGRGAAVAA